MFSLKVNFFLCPTVEPTLRSQKLSTFLKVYFSKLFAFWIFMPAFIHAPFPLFAENHTSTHWSMLSKLDSSCDPNFHFLSIRLRFFLHCSLCWKLAWAIFKKFWCMDLRFQFNASKSLSLLERFKSFPFELLATHLSERITRLNEQNTKIIPTDQFIYPHLSIHCSSFEEKGEQIIWRVHCTPTIRN